MIGAGYEVSPLLHKNTAFFQSVRAPVRRLGLVVQGVRKRELDHVSRVVRAVAGPISKSAAKSGMA